MKVICDRGALLDAVNLVSGVIPARSPQPVLTCMKLDATKNPDGSGTLTLSGTDAETSLTVTLDRVDVAEPGSVAIPSDKLRQIVQAEDGEPTLTIETTGSDKDGGGGGQCHIKGVNAHFRVFAYPADKMPDLPSFSAVADGSSSDKARTIFPIDTTTLSHLVAHTIFATARETSRYAINGVLMSRKGKKVEMVATDGRRLAVARATIKDKGDDDAPITCIIPTKALKMVSRLVAAPDDVVNVAITDSRVYLSFAEGNDDAGRAELTSTLVEGTFPPYEDVIPKDQDKKIKASRESLSRAVSKAAVLTNEESRGVRLAFTAADKRLRLSSRAPEMGEAEIDVDLVEFDGDDIEISFNPAFITDVLKVVDDNEVIVELKATNKPGLIRSAANDFLYVVMPVTLPS